MAASLAVEICQNLLLFSVFAHTNTGSKNYDGLVFPLESLAGPKATGKRV
jgi:hypothetical protein